MEGKGYETDMIAFLATEEQSHVVKLLHLGVSPTKKPKPQKGYLRTPHQAFSEHFHCIFWTINISIKSYFSIMNIN